MSANKYANLPDIDTAQDVYETEDVFPSSQTHGDSSDDEALPTRSATTGRTAEPTNREELDVTHLMGAEEASKRFRKAEKRRERPRTHYVYPPSPTSSNSDLDTQASRPVPLSRRLKNLQLELSSLESELADPSNPLLQKEREEENVDPGELIRGLVDVRGRLEKIRKGKEGRGKLVNLVLGQPHNDSSIGESVIEKQSEADKEQEAKPEIRGLVDMDRRLAELEKLVGSSTTAIDETSPLPLPLVTQISKIHNQLHALTVPRHVDNISRRLKLLMSDLDRVSSVQHAHRRHPSQPNANGGENVVKLPSDIVPILQRLNPALPQIPHILTRLRTLSALHASAGEFQKTLEGLEGEQAKMRDSLNELESAVQTVEKSLEENRRVVSGNVEGLEQRVSGLLTRLEDIGRTDRG